MKRLFLLCLLALPVICTYSTPSVARDKTKKRTGSFYASWGYNQEWYSLSDVHVSQPSLKSEYTLMNVEAHDHKGWDEQLFMQQLTIPQYNYRLGYYFNEKQDLGVELNFDHTKYIIREDQDIRIKGKIAGVDVDKNITFNKANGFYYYLNNGANFFLFNIVKRFNLYKAKSNLLMVDLVGKAGIGPVVPHVENSFFGQPNKPHFQVGGWNAGVETAIRATILRYAFVEFSQKVDHARYSGLKIYEGTVRQHFNTSELILSVGVFLPTTKHNPLFERPAGKTEDIQPK